MESHTESNIESHIKKVTSSKTVTEGETVQSLWSGYGKIVRYQLTGGTLPSIITKQIQPPTKSNHPRGWNTSVSHQRKLKSYQVESNWYQHFNYKCDDSCPTPKCFGVTEQEGLTTIILEDLDASGFPIRKTAVNLQEIKACLDWLANFHATFMGVNPKGLWLVGTYWHLATRPEELNVLDDVQLKTAAPTIDKLLNECSFQTIVHGDAKLANFCFTPENKQPSVSVVDFQYAGGGCGMKDVAYFLGSCLNEQECEAHEKILLDHYFTSLKAATHKRDANYIFTPLEKEWREMFPIAWTDFHRFLKGWSPGHWKLTSYSERLAQQVISKIDL